MSNSRIVTVKTPKVHAPETLRAGRKALVDEYRRILKDVWPGYSHFIGERGIAAIAAREHVSPNSPNFPLHSAHATALSLAARIAIWSGNPPQNQELEAIKAFCEIERNQHGDQDIFELVLERLILRDARFGRLQETIPPNDPELVHIWQHGDSLQDRARHIPDPRTWLYQDDPDVSSTPTKPPTMH